VRASGEPPADAMRGAVRNCDCRGAGNTGNAEMHFLAERIAPAQNAREPMRERIDDRDFK